MFSIYNDTAGSGVTASSSLFAMTATQLATSGGGAPVRTVTSHQAFFSHYSNVDQNSHSYVDRDGGGGLTLSDTATFFNSTRAILKEFSGTCDVAKRYTTSTTKTGSYSLGTFSTQYLFTTSTGKNSVASFFGINPWRRSVGGGVLWGEGFFPLSGQDAVLAVPSGTGTHIDTFFVSGRPIGVASPFVTDIQSAIKSNNDFQYFNNLFYIANVWGTTGPNRNSSIDNITPFAQNYSNGTIFKMNDEVFKQNGNFREFLYVVATSGMTGYIDHPPQLITGGSGAWTFNNEHADDNYLTIGTSGGEVSSYTTVLPFAQPFNYVDFTPGYNGFLSTTKSMRFFLTDYHTATIIDDQISLTTEGQFSLGRDTVMLPFTSLQTSYKLTNGAVITEANSFLSFYTKSGLPRFAKVGFSEEFSSGNTIASSSSSFTAVGEEGGPPVITVTAYTNGFTNLTGETHVDMQTFRTGGWFLPISFSQLYPQVFTFNSSAGTGGYELKNYFEFEPRWSKYKQAIIYSKTEFLAHPVKINLFYGLYSLYSCASGDKTLDRTVAATGVFTTQYAPSGYQVMIKYAPLIDIKSANKAFWSYPSDFFLSDSIYDTDLGANGSVFFFNTWTVGIQEGQKSMVFPVKSNKFMPPENMLDYFASQFQGITASNTTNYTDSRVAPLYYTKQFVFPISVSRAYSTAESYY